MAIVQAQPTTCVQIKGSLGTSSTALTLQRWQPFKGQAEKSHLARSCLLPREEQEPGTGSVNQGEGAVITAVSYQKTRLCQTCP